jgi:hypothetical protein
VVQVTVTVPPPAEYAPDELGLELPELPRPVALNSVTAGEVAFTGGSPRPSNAATRDVAAVPVTVAVPAELCPWVATAVPNPVAAMNDIEPPVTASQLARVPPLAVTEMVMDPVGGFSRVNAYDAPVPRVMFWTGLVGLAVIAVPPAVTVTVGYVGETLSRDTHTTRAVALAPTTWVQVCAVLWVGVAVFTYPVEDGPTASKVTPMTASHLDKVRIGRMYLRRRW